MSTEPDTSTYDEFLEHVNQYYYLGGAGSILGWDQRVMMPDEGTPARSKQQAALSSVIHEKLTAEEFGELLSDLDGTVSGDKAAVVRER